MTRKLMAILAAASMTAACGTLSPTSSDQAIPTAASAEATSMGLVVGPRLVPTCFASGIVLNVKRNEMIIYATFVDRLGNPVSPAGCPGLSWSVSPDSAYVQPLATGPAGADVVELVAIGALDDTVYTVTAMSGYLTGSIDMKFTGR
jgi:hypothetical protein